MHVPVLVKQTLEYLGAESGSKFIDGTVGLGGHAKAILEANPDAKILGLDLDETTVKQAEINLQADIDRGRVSLIHGNYADIKTISAERKFQPVSGVLLDLGFSSFELQDKDRGFSFQNEGPLDMRYDRNQHLTGADVVNKYPEQSLAEIFKNYGEERFARRIARRIVERRRQSKLGTTLELFEVIKLSLPPFLRYKAADSARRIFQALRIEVNSELNNLKSALPDMVDLLAPGGRIVVISFHSLEDRIVKNFLKAQAQAARVRILTKKPVVASDEEIASNPRSKPAKLRAAEKI